MVKVPAFDARALSDDELVVLESTLRVQLAVAKHVRVLQVTALVSGALVTAGLSTLLAGPSIICSVALRSKCKRRHRACCDELRARGVELAPVQETKFAKRALALSVASGLTCCVLGVALDMLFDEAVLQVVAYFFSTFVEGHITQGTTGFVLARAADIVGRDHVYVLDDKPVDLINEMRAINSSNNDNSAGGAAAATVATEENGKQPKRGSSLVALTRKYWKSASWSFSAVEMQAKIREAKKAFRHRPSLREGVHSSGGGEDDDDDDDPKFTTDDWKYLFSRRKRRDDASNQSDDGLPEYETLFGCRIRTTTTLAGGDSERDELVDLVRTDAFNLFGECFVVRVRTATELGSQSSPDMFFPGDPETASFEPRVEYASAGAHPQGAWADAQLAEQRRAHNSALLFSGDRESCAFWDNILKFDDDFGSQEGYEDVEYGIEVAGSDDESVHGVEVWSLDAETFADDSDGVLSYNRSRSIVEGPRSSSEAYEAYDLFGIPSEASEASSLFGIPSDRAAPVVSGSAFRHPNVEMDDDDESTDAFNLFGVEMPRSSQRC